MERLSKSVHCETREEILVKRNNSELHSISEKVSTFGISFRNSFGISVGKYPYIMYHVPLKLWLDSINTPPLQVGQTVAQISKLGPTIVIWGSVKIETKTKTDGSTWLTYTGLFGGLEHLKIETRLRGERFESVKGEYSI